MKTLPKSDIPHDRLDFRVKSEEPIEPHNRRLLIGSGKDRRGSQSGTASSSTQVLI